MLPYRMPDPGPHLALTLLAVLGQSLADNACVTVLRGEGGKGVGPCAFSAFTPFILGYHVIARCGE